MDELKPCPFCGGREITIKGGKYLRWCKCEGCNAKSEARAKKREAIEAWNTRVGDRCSDCLVDRMVDDGK